MNIDKQTEILTLMKSSSPTARKSPQQRDRYVQTVPLGQYTCHACLTDHGISFCQISTIKVNNIGKQIINRAMIPVPVKGHCPFPHRDLPCVSDPSNPRQRGNTTEVHNDRHL